MTHSLFSGVVFTEKKNICKAFRHFVTSFVAIGIIMTKTIKGEFELKATPYEISDIEQPLGLMKMIFNKTFHGELSGSSIVSMMGILNKETGSGGYVAIEKFEGTLEGKKGSFYLQHSSNMNNGAQSQSINIIPNSGTDELASISGSMIIEIKDGKHFYIFDYDL